MTAPQIPNLLETLRASKAAAAAAAATDSSPSSSHNSSLSTRGGRFSSSSSATTATAAPRQGPYRGSTLSSSTTSTANQKSSQQSDQIVQQTDDDAAGSRLSAVEVGYLDDAFARMFYGGSAATARRMPIINRGTYVRTTAIDALVDEFLADSPAPEDEDEKDDRTRTSGTTKTTTRTAKRQIISLGAGSDTRYFRLMQRDDAAALQARLVYHELDFPATVAKKIQVLQQQGVSKLLRTDNSDSSAAAVSIASDRTWLVSLGYNIHGIDLRSLASPSSSSSPSLDSEPMTPPPVLSNLDRHAPTLILSECCLTYLSAETSSSILEYVLGTLLEPTTATSIVLYEPINPHDAFGRTMVSNLAARRIRMPGLHAFPSLSAHTARLKDVGFTRAQEAWEVRTWWDQRVSPEEKERLRSLEGLDEEEEWVLLAGHYALIRASR